MSSKLSLSSNKSHFEVVVTAPALTVSGSIVSHFEGMKPPFLGSGCVLGGGESISGTPSMSSSSSSVVALWRARTRLRALLGGSWARGGDLRRFFIRSASDWESGTSRIRSSSSCWIGYLVNWMIKEK